VTAVLDINGGSAVPGGGALSIHAKQRISFYNGYHLGDENFKVVYNNNPAREDESECLSDMEDDNNASGRDTAPFPVKNSIVNFFRTIQKKWNTTLPSLKGRLLQMHQVFQV